MLARVRSTMHSRAFPMQDKRKSFPAQMKFLKKHNSSSWGVHGIFQSGVVKKE